MGVRNAILRIVKEINASDGDIYVYGPLIHNPQTMEILDNRGLKTIKTLDDINGKDLAIRTHGIPVDEYRLISGSANRIINLTCPRVARVQSIIKKFSRQGYFTIIAGDADHAEVTGLKSYAENGHHVISRMEDIESVPDSGKCLLVSQTTFDRSLFYNFVSPLKEKFPDLIVIDTICDSTRDRLNDVTEGIRNGIDTLVVVGGKNSANTKRLAQIGAENGIKTIHVETDEDIREKELSGSERLMVTAGASTPGWIINNVLERIYDLKFKKSNFILKWVKLFLEFIVRTNILSAVSAFFLTLFAQTYSGSGTETAFPMVSLLYIFSMYTVNNYLDLRFLKYSNHYKYLVYKRIGKPLVVMSALSMAASIFLLIDRSLPVISVIIASYLVGFIYSTPLMKGLLKKINSGIITKIYDSKIITGLGWMMITAVLPMYENHSSPARAVCVSAFIFTVIMLRHIALDLLAFQGDLILGRESLPVWIGVRKIRLIFLAASLAGATVFSAVSVAGGNLWHLLFNLNIIYGMMVLLRLTRIGYHYSFKYEMMVDLNLVLVILFGCLIKLLPA
jgi:4-hydroxy-3-methylbut-2-enyl diphosphate reductase